MFFIYTGTLIYFLQAFSGQGFKDALKKDVIHYKFNASLFDIVVSQNAY